MIRRRVSVKAGKATRGLRCRRVCFLVILGSALVVPTPGRGENPPIEDVAAADAYRESVPAAAGARPTGGVGQVVPLSPRAEARLERLPSAQAQALREVATSPGYGAPTRAAPSGSPDLGRRSSGPSILDVARTVATDAPGFGRLGLLAGLMAAIVVALVAARAPALRR